MMECSMAALQCTVDNQLIDFTDLHHSIRTRTFYFALLSSVHHHTNNKQQRKQQPDDNATPSKRVPIQYNKCLPRWKLRKGEDYRAVFNSKFVDKRPKLNGVPL